MAAAQSRENYVANDSRLTRVFGDDTFLFDHIRDVVFDPRDERRLGVEDGSEQRVIVIPAIGHIEPAGFEHRLELSGFRARRRSNFRLSGHTLEDGIMQVQFRG